LVAMIRTAIDGNTAGWADVLPSLQLAYNTAVHTSTGVAPAEALLRIRPATALSRLSQAEAAEGPSDADGSSATAAVAQHVERSSSTTDTMYTMIADRLKKAAERQARAHDARISPAEFAIGDDVFVYAENTDGDNKLAAKWRGPRRVLSRAIGSDVIYVVEGSPESGGKPVVVHVDHLRRCDSSRISDQERILLNAKADTYIVERVIAHTGDSPDTYRFLILWRGWGFVNATWEPLRGTTSDGKQSGVGNVALVREYMKQHHLSDTTAASRRGRRAARQ
jgi:hypothetical protein